MKRWLGPRKLKEMKKLHLKEESSRRETRRRARVLCHEKLSKISSTVSSRNNPQTYLTSY